MRQWGVREGRAVLWTSKHGGDAQGIAGQRAVRAGALSLSPLAMSAGPDSNPFESPVVLREC